MIVIILIILIYICFVYRNESYTIIKNPFSIDIKKYQQSKKNFKYGCIPRSIYPGLVKLNNSYSKIIRDEFSKINGEKIFSKISLNNNIKFLHIIKNNKPQKISAKFPKLLEALKNVKMLKNVIFSLLPAKTERHMHNKHDKNLFRAHIPIKLPEDTENCGICIEDQCRTWEYDDFLLLDENLMHQVWNNSNTDRIILLIDVKKISINS